MGLFDFFKPEQKSELGETFTHLYNSFFPKGEKDINSTIDELLYILNNKISRTEAKNIIVKSVAISRIAQKFDKDRLKAHLAGYCLQHFNEKQLEQFYNYLVALAAAMKIHRATPSEVRRQGEAYMW